MASGLRHKTSHGRLTISKSLASVVGTPSYGETQLPEIALQLESVTTFVPSRLSTVSLVSQVPETGRKKATARQRRLRGTEKAHTNVPRFEFISSVCR